jgi:hypothetical protein
MDAAAARGVSPANSLRSWPRAGALDLLARAGDLAAKALAVAAHHGPLPHTHDCLRDAAGQGDPRSASGAMTALYEPFYRLTRVARA